MSHLDKPKIINFNLPAITLPCTVMEARAKHFDEIAEWDAEPGGSWFKLVEAWDTLQSAYTWLTRAIAVDAFSQQKEAREAIEAAKLRLVGQPARVRRAKVILLIKNAVREYYSPEDNDKILSGDGLDAK